MTAILLNLGLLGLIKEFILLASLNHPTVRLLFLKHKEIFVFFIFGWIKFVEVIERIYYA